MSFERNGEQNMSGNAKVLSYDMVYMPLGTNEFRNVRIDAFIEKNYFKIVVVSEQDIAEADVGDLINKLRSDLSAKIKVDLDKDCSVFLSVGDKINPIKIPL